MRSQTKGGALNLHHGDQTHIDLWFYSLVVEGQKNISRPELSWLQKSACLAVTGAMKPTPMAAMKVLLGLPPLPVMTDVEGQTGVYRLMCMQQWRPKSTNFGHTKKSQDMKHKPILQMGSDRMLLRYATTSYSRSTSLTSVNGFNPDKNGGWSGTQMKPRPIKTLVLGCTNGAQERGRASVLGSTPWYSRLKYIPLRLI